MVTSYRIQASYIILFWYFQVYEKVLPISINYTQNPYFKSWMKERAQTSGCILIPLLVLCKKCPSQNNLLKDSFMFHSWISPISTVHQMLYGNPRFASQVDARETSWGRMLWSSCHGRSNGHWQRQAKRSGYCCSENAER